MDLPVLRFGFGFGFLFVSWVQAARGAYKVSTKETVYRAFKLFEETGVQYSAGDAP